MRLGGDYCASLRHHALLRVASTGRKQREVLFHFALQNEEMVMRNQALLDGTRCSGVVSGCGQCLCSADSAHGAGGVEREAGEWLAERDLTELLWMHREHFRKTGEAANKRFF